MTISTRRRQLAWVLGCAAVLLCVAAAATVVLLSSHTRDPKPVISGGVPLSAHVVDYSAPAVIATIGQQLAAPAAPTPGLTTSFTPGASVSDGSQTTSVETAFATAVSLHWSLGDPPIVGGAAVIPTASLLTSMLAADTTRVNTVFSAAQATQEMKALNTAIQMQGAGFIVLGGGVSNITYSSIGINGMPSNSLSGSDLVL